MSLGPFRLPAPYFRRVSRLYPEERLFAGSFTGEGGMVSYPRHLEADMVGFCSEEILAHVPREAFYPCRLPPQNGDSPADSK